MPYHSRLFDMYEHILTAYVLTDSFVDNALVLRDPESFILLVMGKEVATQITVNDGEWHHVAVTWSSASGSFVSYQDGLKIAEGTNFQRGQV